MATRLWHKAPFIRFLLALSVGIVLQWHLQVPLNWLLLCFAISLVLLSFYSFTALRQRYQLAAVNGAILTVLFVSAGALLIWLQDVRNSHTWVGKWYNRADAVTVTLEEPLVEKTNSYKAIASFNALHQNGLAKQVTGKLLVYFKKDSLLPPLHYGSQLVFTTPLQEIKNAGNPGSFDYKRYSLFQGITHQVFVSRDDFVVLPQTATTAFGRFVFNTRAWVVTTLRNYIRGEKEQGLAEALLIGYKDDLDKKLVEAYSNTGVVHIIAISGLHLGLIYVLLVWLTKPLKRSKQGAWLRFLLIVLSLWLFSFLAGAQPSVLRSALMFTLIAGGEVALRRTNIFNTLAFSATTLLCINPFWLWDVGFQLSYTAVLSIVLFFQPVYNWFQLPNKALDFLWKLTAVTIAAQVLTLPISIYHFHQAPLLFLLTNFVAVPLSSVILLGEILLCVVQFMPPVAQLIGIALHHLIYWMNSYVEQLDSLPFAVWKGLSITTIQTVLLLVFAIGFCYWLLEKQRRFAWLAFGSFALFMALRGVSFNEAEQQRKLIVYNVPKHTAIDVVQGRQYAFIGDTALLYDDFVRNFHLQPSRILHRLIAAKINLQLRSFTVGTKKVVLINETLPLVTALPKATVDVLILSKNPRVYIPKLGEAFAVKQVVMDGSVPAWKAALWKKDCDSLHIPCYNIAEEGAFVMTW